jgi:hypothetical protein
MINELLKCSKGKSAFYDRLILFYLVFGLAIMSTLSIVLGIYVNYALSIILGIFYFGGLIVLIVKIKKLSSELLK